MEKLIAILGLLLAYGSVFFMSKRKKDINWKTIAMVLTTQFVFAFVLIKTPAWKLVEWTGQGFSWLIAQSQAGIEFVFGDLATSQFTLFFGGLMPVVFISAFIGVLFHYGILQKGVRLIGVLVAKVFNINPIVAVNSVTNMFLGQSDALFVTRSYLPKASESVIFATLVGGMNSVSVAVLSVYVSQGASMEWIVISLPLTVFTSLALTQIVMPTRYEDASKLVMESDKKENVLATMMDFGITGFKAVISIAVALMVFLSAIAFINGIIGAVVDGATLQKIIGVVFYPVAFLMGVPMAELGMVSEILATKLVMNEAVAFGVFNEYLSVMSANTQIMVTVVLSSFAAIGSVGILLGGYSVIAPSRVGYVAKVGMFALLIAFISNLITGTLVGLFL